jgi:CDP-diacylglycerol--serine O-phosphatidyltransferase
VNVRQWLPAIVTLVVLGCGLGALEASRVANWDLAFGLIVLAGLADAVDGLVARWLRVAGPMGAQLDSLADVVAFGAAPAFLFSAHYAATAPTPLRLAVMLAFVSAGVFRLARFNVQPKREGFLGMPITCGGVLFAASVAGPFVGAMVNAAVVGVVLAVLMASHVPFPKFTTWQWRFLPPMLGAAIPLARWPSIDTAALVTFGLFGSYTLWSVAGSLLREVLAGGGREDVPAQP